MAGLTGLEPATSSVTGWRSDLAELQPPKPETPGGRSRTRTCDLFLVREALSQLSYSPGIPSGDIIPHRPLGLSRGGCSKNGFSCVVWNAFYLREALTRAWEPRPYLVRVRFPHPVFRTPSGVGKEIEDELTLKNPILAFPRWTTSVRSRQLLTGWRSDRSPRECGSP